MRIKSTEFCLRFLKLSLSNFGSRIILLLVLLQLSCKQQNDEETLFDTNAPKGHALKGYVVSEDSMLPPQITIALEPKIVVAGSPKVITTNSTVRSAGNPKIISPGLIKECIPGQGGFSVPESSQAKEKTLLAGNPEVVVAKDASYKDENPENFSTFKILQGLKSNNIRCILQDHLGNIWLGTNGGGVTKYDGKSFTHFTTAQGLCNDMVICMIEDKKGNIWFGTNGGGASKYDGNTFSNYTASSGMRSEFIFSIAEDHEGNIWLGTFGDGVTKFDGKTFTNYSTKQGLSNNTVLSILEDKKGNMWFGTNGGGVTKFNRKCFVPFTTATGMSDDVVNCITEDKSGNLWFGTKSGGASMYNGNSIRQFTVNEGLSNNSVYDIKESKNGNLWFATNGGGVNEYNGKTFTYYTSSQGLTSDLVFSICEDKSGTLWFGTSGGGVSRYNGKTFIHYAVEQGLSNRDVKSVLQDKNGNLWLATNGGGLNKYDGKSFSQYTADQGLSSEYLTDIVEDKNGNIWFGSEDEGLFQYDGKSFKQYTTAQGLSDNVIRCLYMDSNENLWIGNDGAGVTKFDGKMFTHYSKRQGLSNNKVQCIIEDKKGNFWFGTEEGGVNKFDGKNFTHFTTKEGLSNNNVRSLLEDSQGNLWLGTEGGGVNKYDGNLITRYTTAQGLSNDVIESMLEDRNGNLWLGTKSGFNKMLAITSRKSSNTKSKGRVMFKSYVIADGFLGMTCNTNSIREDKKGNIWIGTSDRLTCFHPQGDIDVVAPNIQLTDIELFNEKVSWNAFLQKPDTALSLNNGVLLENCNFSSLSKWYSIPENLSLAYNNNYLTFKYIGITTKYPGKVKYKYKLEGVDENWSAINDKSEELTYRNLSPGEFTFRIKAVNSEGYTSNEFNYKFTIRPPWWKTPLAYIAYVLLLVFSITYLVRWRTASLLRQQKILEQTVVERTAEVVHQKEEAEKQREIVVQKNREILDSITYAQRLQEAILPPLRIVKGYLHENFILYKPKDIVAGDFYWMESSESGWVMFAAADCTGHGVPGAMVSVVCSNALNRTVKEFGLTDPGLILDKVRELVIETFVFKDSSGEKSENSVNDGMDISLCAMNIKTGKLKWAGAYNPIWIIRNKTGVLEEIKPDKQPIGKSDNPIKFKTHDISLTEGDCFYIFTDGYADQFGGIKGKKFKTVQMKEMFRKIYSKPMEEQRLIVNETIESWKGELEQVDDICMIGVRV